VSQFDQHKIIPQLHTIADYIRFATTEFNKADLFFGHGYDNALDEAIAAVTHILCLPNIVDPTLLSCRLLEEEKSEILALISARISTQKPLAYLINQAYFAGIPFYVDERVLVPRSPIAELIEQKFASVISSNNSPSRILDLCTGSGCIAIACAYAFPEAEIDAVDLSIDALNVAQINIEEHGLSEQVIPIQSDVFSGVEGQKYDLIVSNPPYVDLEDVLSMPSEYTHEPEMGLGSGNDGLDIVRVILAEAAQHLHDQGILICEVGNSQIHLQQQYPELPFTWLTFERGGHGVFAITKEQLIQFSSLLNERVKNL
jgi:ribosomal protein L3 glutamine methyltransferase